jgi:hypothetical protein
MSLSVFHLLLVIGMCTSATFPQDDKKTMIPPTNHGETILLSADATELTRLAGEGWSCLCTPRPVGA